MAVYFSKMAATMIGLKQYTIGNPTSLRNVTFHRLAFGLPTLLDLGKQ